MFVFAIGVNVCEGKQRGVNPWPTTRRVGRVNCCGSSERGFAHHTEHLAGAKCVVCDTFDTFMFTSVRDGGHKSCGNRKKLLQRFRLWLCCLFLFWAKRLHKKFCDKCWFKRPLRRFSYGIFSFCVYLKANPLVSNFNT